MDFWGGGVGHVSDRASEGQATLVYGAGFESLAGWIEVGSDKELTEVKRVPNVTAGGP